MAMRVVRHGLVMACLILGVSGCDGAPEQAPASDSARTSGDASLPDSGASAGSMPTLPWIGVAIHDTANRWCVALAHDSLPEREVVTIVFPDSASGVLSLSGRIVARRATPCATAFPQLQLAEDATYDLTVVDTVALGDAASVAIAVVSDVRWSRGADGVARADLDRDGLLEEARACRAHEGQYFSLWRRPAADSAPRSVWGRYFDWGAFVDANCAPGHGEETLSWQPAPDDGRPAARAARG